MNDKRILLTLILFIGGYFIFRSFHDAHRSQAATLITGASSQQNQHGDALPTLGPSSPATPLVHASFRPLNFALLRGGFSSVNEFFERVHDDPVLHDFYGDCADRNATMFPLPEDITAFSTFRKGDNIKWAQKPLLIKKGEYVITFCGKTVLARCGNLISVSPMQPSEDVPPALLEAPAEVPDAPLTLVADAAPSSANPVGAGAVPAAAANSRRFFSSRPSTFRREALTALLRQRRSLGPFLPHPVRHHHRLARSLAMSSPGIRPSSRSSSACLSSRFSG